jgi:crossover junction endodeoxyribonuclease RuvC
MSVRLKILGIDPGFGRLGWGLIESEGSKLRHVGHGCLETPASDAFMERLRTARDYVRDLVAEHKPDAVAVEQLFFQTNAKTAINVGMARGVILLAIADAGVPLVELTPNQVKQGVAGHGQADKKQVEQMVMRLLSLKEPPKPDDAADALAIAIVGAVAYPRERRINEAAARDV